MAKFVKYFILGFGIFFLLYGIYCHFKFVQGEKNRIVSKELFIKSKQEGMKESAKIDQDSSMTVQQKNDSKSKIDSLKGVVVNEGKIHLDSQSQRDFYKQRRVVFLIVGVAMILLFGFIRLSSKL